LIEAVFELAGAPIASEQYELLTNTDGLSVPSFGFGAEHESLKLLVWNMIGTDEIKLKVQKIKLVSLV